MKVKKAAIVYHKSDLDGVVSAAIIGLCDGGEGQK